MAAPSPCAIGEGFPHSKVRQCHLGGRASTCAKLCAGEAGNEGGGGDYGWQDSDLLARLDEVLLPGTHRPCQNVRVPIQQPGQEGSPWRQGLLRRCCCRAWHRSGRLQPKYSVNLGAEHRRCLLSGQGQGWEKPVCVGCSFLKSICGKEWGQLAWGMPVFRT